MAPTTPTASPPIPESTGVEPKAEKAYIVHKEVLTACTDIANRLEEILEKCTTVPQFRKTLTKLAKFTREAAEFIPDTIIQLSDPKAVKNEITADLAKWCEGIEGKIDTLSGKQNKILEATSNFNEHANGLQTVAKDLEGQISKVAATSDKIANIATPYRDALLGENGRDQRESVNEWVLIDVECKAKQIMIIIKDHHTALLNPEELANRANEILEKIKDKDRPETVRVDLVAKFLSGSLFYFNSKEVANWIRQPEIEDEFLKQLDKNAYVKECLHNILLHGVPIILDPSKESHL
jgi:hypothetical protein